MTSHQPFITLRARLSAQLLRGRPAKPQVRDGEEMEIRRGSWNPAQYDLIDQRSFIQFTGALAKAIIVGFEPPALSDKLCAGDAILGRWRIIAS